MASWEKWLWGGLGWAWGGPIGGILGFALGSMAKRDEMTVRPRGSARTRPGDFGITLMVLFAAVMRADDRLLKSELSFVKTFFVKSFGARYAQERMSLFKDILKQDYPLKDVCSQVRRNMDHPARLELIHLLFGLAQADHQISPAEVNVISTMSGYLGISLQDFESIKAMFVKDTSSAFKILEIDASADDSQVKKAYRHMANKYHPDKVAHLGTEFQDVAEEKFKAINEAYQQIRKERGL